MINVEKYSPSIFVSIFCSYAVARYQELAIRKTGVKFTLSHKKNISSFNDWNLFRNKFPLRCHRKTVLGCLLLKSLKVLNVSFVFFPLNNCSSELIFSQKTLVVILTCALCQQSNLLKAKSKFSINLLVPPQFKRIPLWLQWYLGFIFELFVKQIFIFHIHFLEICLPVLPSHLIYLDLVQTDWELWWIAYHLLMYMDDISLFSFR